MTRPVEAYLLLAQLPDLHSSEIGMASSDMVSEHGFPVRLGLLVGATVPFFFGNCGNGVRVDVRPRSL